MDSDVFRIQRVGRSFKLLKRGRTVGSAKSQKEARDIARRMLYTELQKQSYCERSHRG